MTTVNLWSGGDGDEWREERGEVGGGGGRSGTDYTRSQRQLRAEQRVKCCCSPETFPTSFVDVFVNVKENRSSHS